MANYDKMSMDQLQAEKAKIEAAIAGFEKKRRQEAMKEMEAVAKKHGMTVNELVGGSPAKKGAKSKSPPKYRNPDDASQTWSGRGRQPGWFKAGLEAGKTPDDMAA